ncbi:hypothetical protein BWI17_09185 [Betaproteobacteria bacterium GR16-43]|nr:hypothetical protein BWI17_09185 [Betaproteobacteria bacterium GR16-43]
MQPLNLRLLMALALTFASALACAQDFKFSNDEDADKAKEAGRKDRVRAQLASPCRDKIRDQKILVLVGESRVGRIEANQAVYGQHFDAINSRLRAVGLRTYTQAEISAQIAQAEVDAYFRNDPDAALNASKKLSAQYILRGVISSQAVRNAMINVNQVTINMNFTLTGADGRLISQAGATNASYAGADTSGMALTLINERADEVVARLYSDYCRNAGVK